MDWQKPSNFSRLVVALATLGVIESWHDESNQVPLMFPEMNEDSHLLWQQALLQAQGQMVIKKIE
jgi:Sec7-like guanine-nucleotide exchange factor